MTHALFCCRVNEETSNSLVLAFLSNSNQEAMLKAKPEELAHQAAELMGQYESGERHPKGFKGSQCIRYALQATLLYLHCAALLHDRGGASCDVQWAANLSIEP